MINKESDFVFATKKFIQQGKTQKHLYATTITLQQLKSKSAKRM